MMSLDAPFSTFSSSPPSSPYSAPVDSSPFPSPRTDPVSLDSPPAIDYQLSPAHPFSASTHSRNVHPQYERKLASPLRPPADSAFIVPPPGSLRPFSRPYGDDAYLHDIPGSPAHAEAVVMPLDDLERDLWLTTIAQAIDSADGKIDLSEQGLTYIPPTISDLAKLVVLPGTNFASQSSSRKFARSATTNTFPGRTALPTRSFAAVRTTSALAFGGAKIGAREEEIHLFLGNNAIRILPNELFNLNALVVLSLRGNSITELPPQISQLQNLRELNVANNKLTYLPAEILKLRLTSLAVEPNPFVQPPDFSSASGRAVSATKRMEMPMPLTELALRALLSPAVASVPHGTFDVLATMQGNRKEGETYLETMYEMPLSPEIGISPPILSILSSCVPSCSASPLSPDVTPTASPSTYRQVTSARLTPIFAESSPCISLCPCPEHLVVATGEVYRRPVFVAHAEERFTWEAEVAGVKIAGGGGSGCVPVRWRGCGRGCLDFLDLTANEDEEEWIWSDDDVDDKDRMEIEA